jgi:hypothetical protein
LNKLFTQFVYGQAAPLFLDAHRRDLAVCDGLVGSLPCGLLSGFLAHQVALDIGSELSLLLIRHWVEPWLG